MTRPFDSLGGFGWVMFRKFFTSQYQIRRPHPMTAGNFDAVGQAVALHQQSYNESHCAQRL
jgi:hypothetical protein